MDQFTYEIQFEDEENYDTRNKPTINIQSILQT